MRLQQAWYCQLPLRVLSLGLFTGWECRGRHLPEGEEVLIGVCGFGAIALDRTGAREAEMGERPRRVRWLVASEGELDRDFGEWSGGKKRKHQA
jgi:hypothetical protein